jgi:hypothetical protein
MNLLLQLMLCSSTTDYSLHTNHSSHFALLSHSHTSRALQLLLLLCSTRRRLTAALDVRGLAPAAAAAAAALPLL